MKNGHASPPIHARERVPPGALASPEAPGGDAVRHLQRALGNRVIERLIGAPRVQAKSTIGPRDDLYEREADRISEAVTASRQPDATIQRKCVECEEKEEEKIRRFPKEPDTLPDLRPSAEAAPVNAPTSEGDADKPGSAPPGPARVPGETFELDEESKPGFLAALQAAVCATADEGMAGTGNTSQGCPWIEYWFSYYAAQPALHVARSIRKFAPETAEVSGQNQVIELVAARVRRSADRWATSGEVAGLPDDVPLGLPADRLLGGLFFRGRTGAAPQQAHPMIVRAELGAGQPLPGSVQHRMESAFGASFSGVRIHTDPVGTSLANRLQARAFSVGEHVAFAGGEYRPGTPVGDALLAHELAHVVQQGAGAHASQNATNQTAFEADADRSASGVVERLWVGTRQLADARVPRLRSGLRLQRCGASQPAVRSDRADCPALPHVPAPASRGSNPIDARGAGIIALARDQRQPVEQRAVQLVRVIICQYYPAELSKVSEVVFDSDSGAGLETTSVGMGTSARGRIAVGSQFVENVPDHLAHEVLRVRHELDHIDQYRAGLTGEGRGSEREFLAFYSEALADTPPGTGRLSHSTRINIIDGALGNYYCLPAAKQREYTDRRDQLLERRRQEQSRTNNPPTEPPTECRSSR